MRVKRLLCSILAFTLVLSTMSFSAFASGTTVSVNTVADLVAAIENASDGDVINIASGTLDFGTETVESITINKAITIQGAGKSDTELVFTSDKSALVIESSNVTIRDLSMKQQTTDNASHITVSKGAWDAPKVQYSDIIIDNVAFEGGKYGMFLTVEDVTVTNCEFSNIDSHHIIIYSVRGESNITNNIFGADTGSKNRHAILFEGGADGLNTSEDWFKDFVAGGTLNISGNTVNDKGCLFVFTNWGLVEGMELSITDNTVNNFDNKVVALDVADGTGDAGNEFSKIEIKENVLILSEDASDRPYFRDQRANSTVAIDATYNYYSTSTEGKIIGDAIEHFPYYLDEDKTEVAAYVADVNGTSYVSIDEAIAAWTNGTTLTLLADVQLSDVVQLKSTEHHILNLGTHTMTAAEGKNAFEIIAYGTGDAERYAITITADADNPGMLDAGKKSCIYYDYSKGQTSGNDRPIIRIQGGTLVGSTSSLGTAGIYAKGTAARKCATFNISGGTFNCSIIGTGKSKMLISGGTFNYSVGSQGDSTCYRLISGGTFKSFGFMTADAANKFGIGSALGTYDVGAYVDDNGYLVVGGPVITDEGTTFVASTDNYGDWNSNLQYSSVKTNELYYTSAEEIFSDCKKGTITLYENCDVDATASGALTIVCSAGVVYSGDIELKSASSSVKIILPEDGEYSGIVKQYGSSNYLVANEDIVDGKKVITYTQTSDPLGAGYNVSLIRDNTQTAYEFSEALTVAIPGDTIKLLDDVACNIDTSSAVTLLALTDTVTIDLNGKKLSPADPEIPTFVAGKTYIIKNGTIEGDVVNNGGDIVIENVNINGDFTVKAGTADISSGSVTGSIVSTVETALDITGGKFTEDPTAYVSDGYDVIRHSDYYAVANLSEEAKSISVEFEKTDVANNEDNLEGKDTYNIVLKANNGDEINELASADLTFKFVGTPVTGGAMDYTIVPADGIALTQIADRFMFNYDGVTKVEESGTSIVIGTLTIEGYGAYIFQTVDATTNVVNATTVFDNLVDYYIKDGDSDSSATTGGLVINTDTDSADKLIGEITDGNIAVPVRTLTINLDFPNAVEDNAIAYQDMKVEITGNIDGVNQTVAYNLGEDEVAMANGDYVVEEDRLVLNNAYTVTVSGAGYRTARYTVTMTTDKTLRFWNNVMDEAQVVEIGKDSSAAKVTFLAGDIVKDNNINIYDLSAVVSYFGEELDTAAYNEYAKYDLNRDGVIDSKDVAYVLVSWNN